MEKVYYKNLTAELRREVESNKGVYIFAVVKNSPAFNADLLTGDILRKINNIEVIDEIQFAELVFNNRGQQIDLEIFRNGKTLVKQIQLN